jgi:hypothetical protein
LEDENQIKSDEKVKLEVALKEKAESSDHSFSFKSILKLNSQFWVVCASIFFF